MEKQSNAWAVHQKYRKLISEEDTFLWLSKGDLKAETESEIVAAQDQAIQTKYYATKILNIEADSKCRLCQQFDEQIYHIISACPILAEEQYIKRHDSVCAQLHFNIRQQYMHHEQLHQNSCNTVFPRDMVYLRNISVDTLHKGDTEDNNINNKYIFNCKWAVARWQWL